MMTLLRTVTCCVILISMVAASADAGWQGGTAKANITPLKWMPMSGYASRGAKHAEGKLTDLWAKVLVMQDDSGHQAVLITTDLIGIDRELSQAICAKLQKNHQLNRDQIAISTSHTHTGPVVASTLKPMHYLTLNEADRKLVDEYAEYLSAQIIKATGEAFASLAPAEFQWGSGTATFAVNRRNNKEADVPKLREAGELKGPSDHAVPVLLMKQQGSIRSVVFGYACHSTTLGTMDWSGDYGGFAQINLEKKFPNAIAMFWAGCGGDQNPIPRRTVELAKEYGRRLADAVIAVTEKKLNSLAGNLVTNYEEVDLALAKLPSKAELEEQSQSTNQYIAARGKYHLNRLNDGIAMNQAYPYPVQVWGLGKDITWVFQGGEVVVDYAIRIKDELGNKEIDDVNVWCAGYSNDVMAYIPSLRVLSEGGYEGGGAMIYYGLPTIWSTDVEETILKTVNKLHQENQK